MYVYARPSSWSSILCACLTVFPTFFGNNRLPRLAAATAAAAPAFSLHRRRRRHEQKKPDQPNSLHRRRSRRSPSSPSFSFPLYSSKANKERGRKEWMALAIGSKCYFGREKVPCTAQWDSVLGGDSGGCPSFAPDPLNV